MKKTIFIQMSLMEKGILPLLSTGRYFKILISDIS